MLQQEEADFIARKNDLNAAFTALDEQRGAAKAEIDTQNAKLVQAKASLDDTAKQKEAVVQSAQQSREAAALAEGRKAELDKSIIEVEQRLDDLRKQEKQLSASVAAGKDTSAELEAAISELEKKKAKLGSEVQNATDAVSELGKGKDRLSNEIQKLEADKSSKEKELLRLDQELQTKRAALDASKAQPAKDSGKSESTSGTDSKSKD